MTIRSMSLCLATLTLACGPREATTLDDDDDDTTTGTTDVQPTTDGGMSVDPEGTETSSATTSSGASTDEETSGESTDTGGMAVSDGRFDLVALGAVLEPAGCAAQRGPDTSAWAIEFSLPAKGGEFAMVESFGPHVTNYACTLADDAFACATETIVDYSRFSGMDAIVHLASAYEVGWDGDGLVGTYTADFGCEGDDCANVVDQWQLTAFPCAVEVGFTGVHARGR